MKDIDIRFFDECAGAHTHGYAQLLVPLAAPMHLTAGDNEYKVTPQELCFIPPGMVHECSYQGRLLAIDLTEGVSESPELPLSSYPMIVPMQGQIIQLVELIQSELRQNPEGKSVFHLYRYLYSKLMERCAAPSIRYMSEYYHQPITVGELARMESYNVTYYTGWFKQQTGFSPSLYLRCIRINRAKELLTDTDLSMMEIAVMVGYSSNSTFTRAFRNITGMTPKAYRECPKP